MFNAFSAVANVAIPLAKSGSSSERMTAELHSWNALAEEWLSSVSALYAWLGRASPGGLSPRGQEAVVAAIDRQERALLALNHSFRLVNSHLVSACGLPPIDLYGDSDSDDGG